MVGGLPQPAAAGSSGLRPEDKARRYTFDKAGRGRPLPSRVAAGFPRGSRRSCGEERRAPCLRPRSASALPASGNSVGTAGELAPDPTRGHVPSVHDVLSGGVDQERLVEQATRGRPARAAPRYHPGRSGRVPWCGDLTETRTDVGKLLLATVLDLHSRRSYRYPTLNGAPCPAHAQDRMPPPVIRNESQNPVA